MSTPLLHPPKVALFDMDGTLVDSERVWSEALSLVFEELGETQTARRLMDVTYGLAWPDAYAALREHFPKAVYGYSQQRLGHALCVKFDALFAVAPPAIPSAIALLRRCRAAGIRCGIVSGSPRATIEANLRALNLTESFDLVRTVPSDDMPRGKPFPDGYLLALKRFGISASEAVAFEDSRVGSTSAVAAGIRTYVCPPPSSAPRQDYPAMACRVTSWDEITF
ncbi:MAG: HAD family phosphatase [Kiritimatiellia bacterium]